MPRMVKLHRIDGGAWWRGTVVMENSQPGPAVSGVVVSTSHVRRLAVAAYLARFKGQSRVHTESDLRGYLNWCEFRGLDPLAATRPHIGLARCQPRMTGAVDANGNPVPVRRHHPEFPERTRRGRFTLAT